MPETAQVDTMPEVAQVKKQKGIIDSITPSIVVSGP
jgi:hypothetical protein